MIFYRFLYISLNFLQIWIGAGRGGHFAWLWRSWNQAKRRRRGEIIKLFTASAALCLVMAVLTNFSPRLLHFAWLWLSWNQAKRRRRGEIIKLLTASAALCLVMAALESSKAQQTR